MENRKSRFSFFASPHFMGIVYSEPCLAEQAALLRDAGEDALAQREDPAQAIDALVEKRLRGRTPDRQELKKLSDALARRGYRWGEIHEALRRYGAQVEFEE